MTDPQSYRWLAPDGSHRVGRKAVVDGEDYVVYRGGEHCQLMRVTETGELTFVWESHLKVWSGKE